MKIYSLIRSLLSRGFVIVFFALLFNPLTADTFIDYQLLNEIKDEIEPVIEQKTFTDLEGIISLKISTVDEIKDILIRELEPQLHIQYENESDLNANLSMSANILASSLLAKYESSTKTIHIVPPNILAIWGNLNADEFRDLLSAILIHEYIHAADDINYNFTDRLLNCGNSAEIKAYNAVIEGHAQYVARQICEYLNYVNAFNTFTDMIGAFEESETEDETVLYLRRIYCAEFSFIYYDGENFITEIVEMGGEEYIEQAFIYPPKDMEVILNPEWYVYPDSRPELTYNIETALNYIIEEFPNFQSLKIPLTKPLLETALVYIPEDDIERIINNLVQAHTVQLQPANSYSGDKLIIAALYEFTNPEEAMHFVASSELMSRMKDEKMNTGIINIIETKYKSITEDTVNGVYFFKKIETYGQVIDTYSLIVYQNKFVAEISYLNKKINTEQLIKMSRGLFNAVQSFEE
jgi:hypothetical protein